MFLAGAACFVAAGLGPAAFAQDADDGAQLDIQQPGDDRRPAGDAAQPDAPAPRGEGVILALDGPVTPANADYLQREIENADAADKDLILIEIDTPGGLVDSMKTIIKAILASDTPVATYVSPQGARSASAGLYIMYAAHVSAMAPATNTGSATPIEIGGGGGGPSPFEQPEPAAEEDESENTEAGAPKDSESTTPDAPADISNEASLRGKIIEDSVAYIRGLAELRGRNAEWAESAVRPPSASVTASEALELGVIDIVADDLDDLLRQMDGKTVETASGERTLRTKNLVLERVEPTFVEQLLGFIADPNVAVILMSLATTGIIIEMWNPGSIFPGVFGVVALLLGLYSFSVLPYNWLGVGLMLVGALLILLEAYSPTFGIAGLFGLALFGAGLFFIFPEGYQVSPTVIGAILASVGAFLALILVAILGSRSHGPMIGADAIRKREGVVDDWDGKEGWVIVEGERWRARSDKPLNPGDKVRVVEVDGLVLVVKQARAGLLGGLAPAEA